MDTQGMQQGFMHVTGHAAQIEVGDGLQGLGQKAGEIDLGGGHIEQDGLKERGRGHGDLQAYLDLEHSLDKGQQHGGPHGGSLKDGLQGRGKQGGQGGQRGAPYGRRVQHGEDGQEEQRLRLLLDPLSRVRGEQLPWKEARCLFMFLNSGRQQQKEHDVNSGLQQGV